MSGSTFGKNFRVTTWGESHGVSLGCVIDGCPAGLSLGVEDIMPYMARRRPGQGGFTTKRSEADEPVIMSGVFEGKTTGTPIAIMIKNNDQHSKDYDALKDVYRPGHADFGFDEKFGIRDHRGGGRSSGRETAARVAAGAVAAKILSELGISVSAKAISTGDAAAAAAEGDSVGGIIECVATGVPAGLGEPVFDKLDARLSAAVMSIGAIKGGEIGDGFAAAGSRGSENNDEFFMEDGRVKKFTNHSGGILGGISDGSDIILRCAVKPTPSISKTQNTVTSDGSDTTIEIAGRHDTIIVPRAVVVVECMVAITLVDALMENMHSKIQDIVYFYK